MKILRSNCTRLTLFASIAFSLGGAALGNEVWVPPTHVETPELNLIWPVTGFGLARFAFAVPDDLSSFTSARVVFLPTGSVTGTYNVYAEVKRDGETVSIFDVTAQQAIPLSLSANQITEVDVSSALAAFFDGTSPGNDYVSLLLYTPGAALTSARVLGLRFTYAPVTISTADIDDGAITSAKILDGTVGNADIAANAVTGAKIADGTITGADIANNTITGAEIQDRSLSGSDLATGAIGGNEIQNGTVTLADLAANSVDGTKIVNNSITGADVLDGSITGADIANGSLTRLDVAANTLTGAQVMDNSITSDDIRDGTLTNADLATDAVNGSRIQNNTINSSDIADGSVTAADLATASIRGAEISNIRVVDVGCNGECNDSSLGQICDVAASGWVPLFVSMSHNFNATGTIACGGDNQCTSPQTLSRFTNLQTVCQDGNSGDCRVFCIAP